MIRNTLLITFLSLQLCCFGQNPKAVEADLLRKFNKIDYWWEKTRTDNTDSSLDWLVKSDSIFMSRLLYYANKYPFTLTYNFSRLDNDSVRLSILTSDDSLFRIYTWDNSLGGTCYRFSTVFQYKTNTEVKAFSTPYPNDPKEDDYYTYDDMFTFKTNGKTYYLATQYAHGSGRDRSQAIKIYTINEGKLNDTVKLIKTRTGLKNRIEYEYDFFASDLDYEEHSIHFNKADNSIYIPIVYEDGTLTKKYIKYRFTGKYFEKDK